MSKNALVLDDHFGDDGSVTAGMILRDLISKRFTELEKQGLVREATAAEVEAGDQHSIEPDESGNEQPGVLAGAIEQARREVWGAAQAFIDNLIERHEQALSAGEKRTDDAMSAHAALEEKVKDMQVQLDKASKAIKEQTLRAETAEKALESAQAAEKKQPAAANKKAADPANKSA